MAVAIERHRTAMSRTMLSRPVALAFDDGVLTPTSTVFDYGCGRGGDVQRLQQLGVHAAGWDPNHRPDAPKLASDVVNLGYVINVIDDVQERRDVIRRAWSLAKRVLVVAARPAWEARGVRGSMHRDGVLTSKSTFQKFYEQDELRDFVESTLGVRAMAAAPGIFYVFRDEQAAQSVLAQRARRPRREQPARVAELLFDLHRADLEVLESHVDEKRLLPAPGDLPHEVERRLTAELGSLRGAFWLLRRVRGGTRWADVDLGRPSSAEKRFDLHRELLEPLMSFVDERGRLPKAEELIAAPFIEAEFGSIRAAFSLVRRVTGPDRWSLAEDRARQALTVYCALSAFGGRPRFTDLPPDLQLDVKEFFGSYKLAVAEADRLLYSVGDLPEINRAVQCSKVGKLTPEALYVHVSSLDEVDPVLRVYEGCGRALSGTVEGATIIKLHREKAQVSYLSYPDFDRDPHPALATVVVSRLAQLKLTFRDFRGSENPPILHRKETFVGPTHPLRERFARLTAQEEKRGLLSSPTIGTRLRWEEHLREAGLTVRGHRLVTARSA